MSQRGIVIGIVILVILAGLYFFSRRNQRPPIELPAPQETTTPEEEFEERFQTQIPVGAVKSELKDITGGEGRALVVKETVGNITKISILADLPELGGGEVYQAWLVDTQDGKETLISLGRLTLAKGGFVIEVEKTSLPEGANKIVVSKETKFDQTIETRVLEGTF